MNRYFYKCPECNGDGGFRVKSNAREWKKEVTWDLVSEIDALEKIFKLVDYKERDRNRGRGDTAQDLDKAYNALVDYTSDNK